MWADAANAAAALRVYRMHSILEAKTVGDDVDSALVHHVRVLP